MTREEALKQIINPPILGISAYPKFAEALNMAIEVLLAEVIQGEWLPRWSEVECSRCGEFEKKKSNFCPTCGAKMVERG